ncbi:hypothetical protein CE91St56_03780 [Lachnospiraceae bacterium]|nr:hypothetical protein CE91St56_03780 [Lachnospiraceae bacterium]GKH39405.1 hypothetical protein CE91St57_03790 [Lachnospiraceae bacterium]
MKVFPDKGMHKSPPFYESNYTYVDYELSIAQENKKIKWAWQRGYGKI